MGATWDGGDTALRPEVWRMVYDAMIPGAHLLSFGGTRTYHRMACAVEDANFEIRDCIAWINGTGMTKSRNVHTDITKLVGDECADQYRGIGTGLKPSHEDILWATKPAIDRESIVVARKPMSESTVAANILKHDTGGLNIDACRLPIDPELDDHRLGGKGEWSTASMAKNVYGDYAGINVGSSPLGRFPANTIHDGSPQVLEAFAAFGQKNGGHHPKARGRGGIGNDGHRGQADLIERFSETGTAARFFYHAKASERDRAGSKHFTIKPLALMRYLVKLVVPRGGVVLDPFAGSGTTGEAAALEGFNAILIEKEEEYIADCRRRLALFL